MGGLMGDDDYGDELSINEMSYQRKDSMAELQQLKDKRQQIEQVVKKIENTKEYEETGYYSREFESSYKDLVMEDLFWNDLAAHLVAH